MATNPVEKPSGAAGEVPSGQITEPIAVPSPAAPAIPSAAATVANGPITEDTLALKKKLTETEAKLKQREIEHASLTDEHQRYKDATEARAVPIQRGEIKPKTKPFRLGRFV